MRRIFVMAMVATAAGAALVACGSSSDELCEFSGTCPGSASQLDAGGGLDADATVKPDGPIGDDSGDGSDLDAADATDVFVPADAGPCTATSDPYGGCYAVDGTGIFVSPAGSDAGTANGTKAKPFKFINDAIAALSAGSEPVGRMYVCKGDYAETVSLGASLTGAMTIYGGLDCTTWSYNSTAKVHVISPVNASALQVKSATKVIEIHDVAFESPAAAGTDPGTGAGNSSIAAFVSGAADVTFVRGSFTAGAGVAGKAGVVGTSNHTSDPQGGNPGTATRGAGKTCTCADATTTTSGGGGDPSGTTAQSGGGGDANPHANPEALKPGNNGAGGQGFTNAGQVCTQGHIGANGLGGAAVLGAQSSGTLTPTGWVPMPGSIGNRGNPAQGGGGGGGDSAIGGGGGACGGCGGAGGTAGSGGGASIALAMINSTVKFSVSDTKQRPTFSATNGGQGGKGGDAQIGQSGGTGGPSGGCKGGDGANGGGGTGGGGGGGGPSLGVAYTLKAPLIDGSPATPSDTLATVTLGTPGPLGGGGNAGPAGTTGVNGGIPGNPGGVGTAGVAKAVIGF